MVYSSLPFLFVFLPALLLVHFAAPRPMRNGVLALASLLFYAWGGMDFIAILLGFIVVHWAAGLTVQYSRDRGRSGATRALLAAVLVADLGLLAWFKYANFSVDQSRSLAALFGWPPPFAGWQNVLLPIGISFFTFQAMSYLIDVARGTVRALTNFVDFALYLALFPQLIAGPIVRYAEVEDQIRSRRTSWEEFSRGFMRFSHGVAKKVLIADSVGLWADAAFARPGMLSMTEAWIGAISYAIQIYFDFSGYSDMAIGLGRMFGFKFPENFDRPYAATSMTGFWRRWHMTLTRWFRDYLYIPLGGSRAGTARTLRNLIMVFAATGIWHGSNWTFLLWGLWHGAWLIAERTRLFGLSPDGSTIAGRIRTLLVVLVGWVIFRSDSLNAAGVYLQAMAGFGPAWFGFQMIAAHVWYLPVVAFVTGLVLLCAPAQQPWGLRLTDAAPRPIRPLTALAYSMLFVFAVVNLVAGSASPFLYFRF